MQQNLSSTGDERFSEPLLSFLFSSSYKLYSHCFKANPQFSSTRRIVRSSYLYLFFLYPFLPPTSDRSLEQAEENMKVSGKQYEVGLETLSDYLEAQMLWQQAYQTRVDAHFQLYVNYIAYLKAAGQLHPTD